MARRILGQCDQSDFAGIEHLACMTDRAEDIDLTTLTSKQRCAFRFICIAFNKGISWDLIRQVVRQVLFWGEGDEASYISIKFKKCVSKESEDKVLKFTSLWKEYLR